jgi:6,7-dimethyl-8-ribityllumazine synthase
MPRTVTGTPHGESLRIGVAVARWNDFITERLLAGCLGTLERHGVAADDVTVAWAPGSWELPLVCQAMARGGEVDAVIALGAVIRGATGHYEFVAGQCAAGLARVATDTGIPVIFGVLTTDTIEQAIERAGTKAGNKGAEAATSAIEMATLLRTMAKPGEGAG